MRTLEADVPKTISSVLSTHDWNQRKQLIESVFIPNCKFWHLFFQTMNRRELFGVYQMWGAYNFWIDVKYTRVVPDKKQSRVVVDLIETIVESYLLLNPILTLGLGPLALKYLRPPAGALYAAIGNWRYSKLELSNQYKEKKAGFTRIERDLRHAISTAYGGSPEAKWDCSQRMYSEDAEFWHPLFIVKGRKNIFGAHMFWASINRRTNAHIQRIVLSHKDDLVLTDLEQQFWPYFFPRRWKCFALWVHVILTLEDSKDGKGKVITKQEDHILWVESLVMRNLGPVSHWFNIYVRRYMGIFFCFLGNLIYTVLVQSTGLFARLKGNPNSAWKQGLSQGQALSSTIVQYAHDLLVPSLTP